MEKTITLTMTERQAQKLEKLLDEFSDVFKTEKNYRKITDNETQELLSLAKTELEQIRQFNSSRKKMIWE